VTIRKIMRGNKMTLGETSVVENHLRIFREMHVVVLARGIVCMYTPNALGRRNKSRTLIHMDIHECDIHAICILICSLVLCVYYTVLRVPTGNKIFDVNGRSTSVST
jgi:hypothetical protein